MNVNEFTELFKEKMAELTYSRSELIIRPTETDEYSPTENTFLFNCAVFDLVKEKRKEDSKLCIKIESKNKGLGRVGYSDIIIARGTKGLIEIEHENSPEKKKGNILNLKHCIKNLSESKAKEKLLISYYTKKLSKDNLVKKVQEYVNEYYKIKQLYLLCIPWECVISETMKSLKLEIIEPDKTNN